MSENPYESPREAGYRAPQQPVLDAKTKDRMLLLVTAAVAYVALMGLAGVLFIVRTYFPGLSDPEVQTAISAVFLCIALVAFVVWVRRR